MGKRDFLGIRNKNQIHHELTGQQVAALQLCPKALLLDQRLHQYVGIIDKLLHFNLINDTNPLPFDGNDHRYQEFLCTGIKVQVKVDDLPYFDAIKLHRSAYAEPAY